MDSRRRLFFIWLVLQGTGLVLGLLIPPGEATLRGLLLLIATVVLLFPGSVLEVFLYDHMLPKQVLQSQRVDSMVNVVTAVVLNCLVLGLIAAVLRRRRFIGRSPSSTR